MNLINIAHAQDALSTDFNSGGQLRDNTIGGLIEWFVVFINDTLIYLIFALAFLLFIWGVFKYFFGSGSSAEENRREGSKFILWGIIAFAIMISVWGIVNVLVNTFGFNQQSRPDLPCFDGNNCNKRPGS